MEFMEQPDRRAMRVFAKGMRVQILTILTGRSATAGEIATEIGADPAVVGYHVRVLRKCGAIEPERGDAPDGADPLYRARQ